MALSKTIRTVPEAPAKHDYEVLVPGWVARAYRKVGDVIALTEAEAKYDLISGKLALKRSRRSSRGKKEEARSASTDKPDGD